MQKLSINIIAFDIPYPANYGGIIDIFYKLKTLKKLGANVILHCFEYNKSQQKELDKYCSEIYYYPRKNGLLYLFSKLPFIVVTRNNKQLLINLKANDFPILFEGLHSCYFLNSKELKQRKKIVRAHNIEHHYYKGLYKSSRNIANKFYYYLESRKLKKFEHTLKRADSIVSISKNDKNYFSLKYKNVKYIPAFHPYDEIITKTGKGNYFLYHGKLSVEENIAAVNFLIDRVFCKLEVKLLIAGKDPDNSLIEKIGKFEHIELIANPSPQKMEELLVNAHCCVLPTFQGTGLKLKLLVSLFSSRFVIANRLMVDNTSLEDLCIPANAPDEFIEMINKIAGQEFKQEQLEKRIEKLRLFSNQNNGSKLLEIINSL